MHFLKDYYSLILFMLSKINVLALSLVYFYCLHSCKSIRINRFTKKMKERLENRIYEKSLNKKQYISVTGDESFLVLQFNMLADAMAENTKPWFLLGLDLDLKTRSNIMKKYYTKNDNGQYTNSFVNRFDGLITQEQAEIVEDRNEIFDWRNRSSRIMNIVAPTTQDSTVLAPRIPELLFIEELDKYEEILEQLNKDGRDYEGVFAKRPGTYFDGCGIFWDNKRFVSWTWEEIWMPVIPRGRMVRNAKSTRVATYVVLEDTKNIAAQNKDSMFILAVSAHLERNPEEAKKEYDRKQQIEHVFFELAELITKLRQEGDINVHNLAIVFGGDFNALPTSASMVFLQENYKPMANAFFREVSLDWCSTATEARTMWIDYLWYDSDLLALVDTFVENLCRKDSLIDKGIAIPDLDHPSDHIPVYAEFIWKHKQKL